jgi:LmbE family N-acetylglucosaminyl deacetylase
VTTGRGPAALVLAAHPDDETLGASSVVARARRCLVVHLTDGAPRDPALRAPGYRRDRAEYALARRGELTAAMALAGVGPERLHALGATDGEAIEESVPLARRLAALVDELRPRRLVTHGYEGGHPDHDAAALVARAALRLLARAGRPAPPLLEMAVYHGGPGRLVTLDFLPAGGVPTYTVALDAAAERRKRSMLACFESQRDVLGWFGSLAVERLRPAPAADFARPPHEGPLWYERLGFALTPYDWRARAARALAALERERLR